MRTLIVTPAFNEACAIGSVVRSLSRLELPICVVDDGSSDDTKLEAEQAGATVLRLPVNVGVGGALRCGFRHAVAHGYDCVVQVDGDGQHNPDDVPRLLDALARHDADMAIGSRFATGGRAWPLSPGRRFAMQVLAARAAHAVRQPVTDATSGFRAIRGQLLALFAQRYPADYLGDTLEALVLAGRMKARIVEVPVRMMNRTSGQPSAGSLASAWYLVRVLIAIELSRPLRHPPPALPSAHGVTG